MMIKSDLMKHLLNNCNLETEIGLIVDLVLCLKCMISFDTLTSITNFEKVLKYS